MRIKLLRTVLLTGNSDSCKRGAVVEIDEENPVNLAEANALIKVGLAKKTTEAVSTPAAFVAVRQVQAPAVVDTDENATADDDALREILKGNTGEVVDALDSLDKGQLQRLLQLEAADGSPRKGVSEAITAAIDSE